MSGYVYKGAGHRLGIHKELLEGKARDSGPAHYDEDVPVEGDEPQARRGPLTIAEIFGLRVT